MSHNSIFATLISNRIYAGDSAGPQADGWEHDGKDGARSYSYTGTNAKYNNGWVYSIQIFNNDGTPATNANGIWQYKVSTTGKPYERLGNLYNWSAATLNSGQTITAADQEAPDSICPKGWRLSAASGDKSRQKLIMRIYNLKHGAYGEDSSVMYSNQDYNKLVSFPLDIARVGHWWKQYGGIRGPKEKAGHYWVNRTYTYPLSYYDGSYEGNIFIPSVANRGDGYSIRCVAN